MLLLNLLACAGNAIVGADTDPADTDPVEEIEAPCTPVAAVLFDLGGTLLVEGNDGLFEDAYDVDNLLDALEAAAIPVGIVTNVPATWTIEEVNALLAEPTFLDRFDVVLLSSEAESRPKPSPDIFLEALALLPEPVAAGQALFVTEELPDLADAEPPTRGARAAGLVGVHLSDATPDPLADRTVTTADFARMAAEPWVECLEAE